MKLFQEFLHILYPSFCLHCKKKILFKDFFCSFCKEDFYFLSKKDIYFKNVSISFMKEGAIKTFFFEMKKEKIYALFKIAASFMVYQYFAFDFPMPDYIIAYSNRCSDILAKNVSKILKRPKKKFFFKNPKLYKNKIFLVVIDYLEEKELEKIRIDLQKKEIFNFYVLGFCN